MLQLGRLATKKTGIRLSGGTELTFATRLQAKTAGVRPAIPPQTVDPYDLLYDANAPQGFHNLGEMLSYYVTRNRPTYRMADYPPEMGLIAVEAYWIAIFVPIANAYFYLHRSLVPQCWYFVYRYLYNSQQPPGPEMGPAISVEDAEARGYEYILIQSDAKETAARGSILSVLPPLENNNVVAVSQGKPSIVYAH